MYKQNRKSIKFRAVKVRTNIYSYRHILTYKLEVCYVREYVSIQKNIDS